MTSLYLLRSINDLRSSVKLRESHVAKTKNAEGLGLEQATFVVSLEIQHRSLEEPNASLVQLCLKMFGATAITCIIETLTLSWLAELFDTNDQSQNPPTAQTEELNAY